MRNRNKIPQLLALLLGLILASGTVQAVTLDVGDNSGLVGDTVLVPVMLSEVDAAIWSVEINMTWYGPRATFTGVETAGTLTELWALNFRSDPGSGNVACAGAVPLAGNGVLFYLEFLLGPNYGTATLTLAGAILNEGDPVPELVNGQILINALPTVNISPDSGLLLVGGSLEFATSGGTGPYTYTTSDPSVADFPGGDNILSALSPGSVQVFTEDAGGITNGTTGLVEVRPFRLEALNISGTEGQTVLVPILLFDPAGYGIVSAEITASWYASYATFNGVQTGGTLIQTFGWSTPAVSSSPGSVFIAAAGDQPLAVGGLLLFLEFTVHHSFTLNLEPGLFNETYQALPVNGQVAVTPLPSLTLSPPTTNLLVGDQLQLVIGGFPTYPVDFIWNGIGVVDVSAEGLVTALASGWSEIWVYDFLGARTNNVLVNVFDVALPALSAAVAADETVLVPVKVDRELDDLDIFSLELGVSFSSYYVEFLGATSTGSATESWGAPLAVDEGDLVKVYHAGATALEGCPAGLVFLEFRGLPTIGSTYSGFSLHSALFNEGRPRVLLNAGDPCEVVAVPLVPSAGLIMLPNHPNPFNPGTNIRFRVGGQGGQARLAVYSPRGQLVRALWREQVSSGSLHEVYWDGRDDNGRQQPSGVYFSRVEVAGQEVMQKMMLIK